MVFCSASVLTASCQRTITSAKVDLFFFPIFPPGGGGGGGLRGGLRGEGGVRGGGREGRGGRH